ncbi:MAG TPA: hypothetical protein DEO85_00890 [Maritimibacter sp.]|nr:hypothetical protein [Maritimibacter sp.]
MGWLDRFTGRKRTTDPTESHSESPASSHRHQSMDELYANNADILDGWRLHVTMSLTTPLEWLLRDGEIAKDQTNVPQQYGIWVPKTKGWRDLGFDLDELPPGPRASQIGQIPSDGGDFLPFLIQYRTIVEADDERETVLARLSALGEEYPSINSKLGGDLAQAFVVSELTSLSGCGATTATRLYHAGFFSKEQVLQASVEDLTKVKGIGPSIAGKILAAEKGQ